MDVPEFSRLNINIDLMYFLKSDITVVWINFCLEASKKQFLLEKKQWFYKHVYGQQIFAFSSPSEVKVFPYKMFLCCKCLQVISS